VYFYLRCRGYAKEKYISESEFQPTQGDGALQKQGTGPFCGNVVGPRTSCGVVRGKEKTTCGLSPRRLARILAIGSRPGDARNSSPSNPTPAEVLQDILSIELPLGPSSPSSLPAILDRPCREVLTAARRTIGDLLLDAETDLEILRG